MRENFERLRAEIDRLAKQYDTERAEWQNLCAALHVERDEQIQVRKAVEQERESLAKEVLELRRRARIFDEIKKRVEVMRVSESKSWEMGDGTIHSTGEHSLRVYDDILAILDEYHKGNK